ncbi:DUF2934 domain-containing protein [Methylomonas sp. ZR1]|uniref:DUF2934 domain-containing protein n=1 Tax=Methylomonas sp. ZR1 TaxID=1797072 RepID=UPI001492E476|nr:DUF2934 domain-containing protein [Methylomonas sp. ZR1]NOV32727.1 DUF2934 domain-containing protein [Methylomonas sp. ZR1]
MTKSKSTAASKKTAQAVAEQPNRPLVTPEERYRMIAEAAYYRAEKHGFAGGDMAEDWREAEAEIDCLLQQTNQGNSILPNHEIPQQVQTALESEPTVIADKVPGR